MNLSISSITSLYSNFFRTKNWTNQILSCKNGKVFIYLVEDYDYIIGEIGDGAEQDVNLLVNLDELVNPIKALKDKTIQAKIKGEKINFSTEDKKNQFVLNTQSKNESGKDIEIPAEIDSKKFKEQEFNKDSLSFASKFCGQEYPLCFVYYCLKDGLVFSTDGTKIYSTKPDFKDPDLCITKSDAQLLSTINFGKVKICKEDNLLVAQDNHYTLCISYHKVDPKIQDFIELCKKPKISNLSCPTQDLYNSLISHFAYGVYEVQIEIKDNVCKIRSTNEKNSALQTTFDVKFNSDFKSSFKTKDLQLFITNVKGNTSISQHPDHSEIMVIMNDVGYLAST